MLYSHELLEQRPRATGIAGDTGALPHHAQGIEPQETAFERLSWRMARTLYRLPQRFDMSHQQVGPALQEIQREKARAYRHGITTVIRHR